MDLEQTELPAETNEEGEMRILDEDKPRWKVATFAMLVEVTTVYAADQAEAIEAVEKGFGRHAGREGPEMVGQVVVPFDSPMSKDFIKQWGSNQAKLMTIARHAQAQEEAKKIIVPAMSIKGAL